MYCNNKFKVGQTPMYGIQRYLVKAIALKDNMVYYTLSTKSGDIVVPETELS